MPFTSAYYNKKMMKPKHIMIAVVFRLLAVPFAATAQVPAYLDRSADIEVRVEDALSRMTLEEKIAMVHAQSKFSSPGVPRLGIPEVWMSDGPHGVRAETLWDEWKAAGWTNDACTAFPCLECLAATWNPSLAGEYGKALGEEARYRGKTVILGPGVNIVRTPLCGRNHEYMGEEPLLAGTLAAEYIRGVQSCGVAACVKHFALNNQEARRHRYNAVVADAALHELYLPAFRTAVRDGGIWAMMGAYNKYKDEYCCHNGLLVRDILKDGWGFDGVFVSDWGGTHDTLQAVRGGLDIEFGTHTDGLSSGERNAYDDYFLARPYLELIREGTVGTEELDDKVRRVLRLVFRTTMAPDRPWGSFGSGAHSDVARRVAEEGIVLLKNDGNILPLSPGRLRRILVVGWNAQLKTAWGGGSAELKARYEVTPLDALRSHPSLTDVNVEYEPGYIWNRPELADSLRHAAVSKAASADVVLFFGGLLKWDAQDGEGIDRKSYNLPYAQDRLISELAAANPRTVVTMVAASAVAMPWNDSVPAILYAWYGGSEAGNAVTSTLLGDNAPSGRLPFTIYRTLDDCGAHFLDAYNPDSDVADYSEGRHGDGAGLPVRAGCCPAAVAEGLSGRKDVLGLPWRGSVQGTEGICKTAGSRPRMLHSAHEARQVRIRTLQPVNGRAFHNPGTLYPFHRKIVRRHKIYIYNTHKTMKYNLLAILSLFCPLFIQKVLDGFSTSPEDGYTILFHDGTYNIGSFYTDEDYLQPTALRIGVMHTDLEKLLIYNGKDWVDTFGRKAARPRKNNKVR